jgi:hypothetical protein
MAAQPTTPWPGGGGAGPHSWAQPPAPLVPQQTGGGPVAAMRDRSNEGLDIVDRFATGPHCRFSVGFSFAFADRFPQTDPSLLHSFFASSAPS